MDGKVQVVGAMTDLAKCDKPAVRVFFEGPRGRSAEVQFETRGSGQTTASPGAPSSKPK